MVSITSTDLNLVNHGFDVPGLRAAQNIQEIVQEKNAVQTVRVDDRNVMSPRISDALSRIQELVEKGINASGIINQQVNLNMTNPQYFTGTLKDVDAAKYAGFEGVPTGNFQVFTPPQISDDKLKDLVKSAAQLGGLAKGDDALFKALQNDTAKIYNQKDSESLLGKPVDWKQGSIGGTMWDRNAIDQKAVQQVAQDGKKIFAGAIGSIHFSVVY